MAQNWHKNFDLVRACRDFTWRVSDCEELVGVTWSSSDSVKN